jgi:thiol-disulfide isomerase/thioredoxin
MQGEISTPQRLVFNISPGNWNFKAFVENDTINLIIDTTDAQHYGHGNNKWALIWAIGEHGSKLSDVYTKYVDETNAKYAMSKVLSLHKKLIEVKGDTVAEEKINNEIDSVSNFLFKTQKAWIENYINQNPSSIAGVYVFYDYYNSLPGIKFSYLDSVLHIFQGRARSSLYYKELYEKALDLGKVQAHKLAPDFTLPQRNKLAFTLSSKKGNYILLDFWASWCAPCRKAIPFWKGIYARYKNKGLLIVSISSDAHRADWIKALEKEQMPWIQVIDKIPGGNKPGNVDEKFGITRIPFYVLIDKQGRIITSSAEEDVIKNKIEEVLK